VKGKDKHLALVVLCWFVPLTLTVVVGAHFKFQYWLPAALPLLSNLVLLFPEPRERLKPLPQQLLRDVLAILVIMQLGLFIQQDVAMFQAQVSRVRMTSA